MHAKFKSQSQPAYDASSQKWIPACSNAEVDFYDLVNPIFLTRMPPPAQQVRHIVNRYRASAKSSYYLDADNPKLDRCLYAFDIWVSVPGWTKHLDFAEFLTLSFAGVERVACKTELFDLEGQSPQEFMDRSPENNVSDVKHHGLERMQIKGWGSLQGLPEEYIEGLQLDSLVGFDLYLCSKDGKDHLIADETMLLADRSWVISQPYGFAPHVLEEYRRAIRGETTQ